MPAESDYSWSLPESLRELAEEGNEDLVQEVLAVFRTDCTERFGLLRDAMARDDRSKIRNQAHALKGSSAQVGANAMAATCRDIELMAADARADSLAALVERAERQFREVWEAMTRLPGE